MRFSWLAAAVLFCTTLVAQESAPERLKVAVFDHPPFAQKDESGEWSGLAIDLWERVAAQMDKPFDYVDVSLEDAIRETADGRLDVVAGAIAISAERERRLDFTQPFLATSAAVAVTKQTRLPHWVDFVRDVMNHGMVSILALLVGAILVFSVVLWLVERRNNDTHFGGKPIHGFGSALWFAAVTMTTVGYGDKTPRTVFGRTLVFFWMFFGIFVVGVFTATLASSIAISRTQTSITRLTDLASYRNGVLEGSLLQEMLRGMGIPSRSFPSVEDGLVALDAGEINAFVDLEVTLRYVINQNYPGRMFTESLPSAHVGMAFAIRPRFGLLEPVNIALIEATTGSAWSQEIERWVGPPVR